MLPDNTIAYELKGKSLEAVQTLFGHIRKELMPAVRLTQSLKKNDYMGRVKLAMMVTPILTGCKPDTVFAAIKAIGKRDAVPLLSAFEEKYKDLYDAVGRNARAIQIRLVDGGYPRAYAHTPVCYFHPADHKRAVMFVPVDYKGESFVPQDAEKLSNDEARHIDYGLTSGGHSSTMSAIAQVFPYGVATPADFDPQSPTQRYEHFPAPFDHKKAAHVLECLERCKRYLVDVGAIEGVKYPNEFTFKSFLTTEHDGRMGIIAQAISLKDNATLSMKANACFTPEPIGDAYKMVPTPKTAGGQAFQSIMDSVPPLSAEDIWLISDAADREFSTPPPPLPPELAYLHAKPHGTGPMPSP